MSNQEPASLVRRLDDADSVAATLSRIITPLEGWRGAGEAGPVEEVLNTRPAASRSSFLPVDTPRVLVADDEVGVRQLLAEYLTQQGFEVLEAVNGLETLRQVKQVRPAGVVLDLRMPRLGGLDALKRIRAFAPETVVIILTADPDPDVSRQAFALGARAVFGKPVDLAQLVTALRGGTPQEPRDGPAATSEQQVLSQPPGVTAGRVLVVDDDPEIRALLEEFLTGRGFQVRAVANGAAAVLAIAEAPPDVVLLDIQMPGLSGADAQPAIRAIAPETKVIMVSGTGDEDLARRTLAQGAFDYLVKPIDFTHLVQSLEAAIAMKALDS